MNDLLPKAPKPRRMKRSARAEVIAGLRSALIKHQLHPEAVSAICAAAAYIDGGFFNEDASREIDRLTAIVDSQEERIQELENEPVA